MNEERTQSIVHPAAGSGAELIHELGVVLYAGGALIFVAVMLLALRAVLARGERIRAEAWVIGGGLVFPVAALTALLVYSFFVGNALPMHRAGAGSRIEVVGKQWWWEVRYEAPNGAPITLANELRIPVGEPVQLALSTSDVIHSFWVPSLAGKVDMIPGRVNTLVITADAPGVYRGQCAEYCGGQHALMAFYVIAQTPEDFRAWLEREAEPAPEPADDFLRLGRDMFFHGDCHECHTIRGTPANGRDGPDLTHVGSRRSLGAGALRNHIGTMAGWIAGAQDVKPGNRMPSMNVYSGRELRALSAWLMSLE
jgi:cytochrome c oxidase subunit 2